MSKSKIEWTERTWNPVRGCTRVSPGCEHCYAERMAARGLPGMKSPTTGEPFAILRPSGPRWTGKVELIEHMLDIPFRRCKPTTFFVNSMSDLFHESLPDEAIDRIFAVMALCPQHTFQVLTKRAGRMRDYLAASDLIDRLEIETHERMDQHEELETYLHPWPLPNVWLGVSVEDQQRADERIPLLLLQTPAAVRFISAEPLLGPVDLSCVPWPTFYGHSARRTRSWPPHPDDISDGVDALQFASAHLDWVIVGGESGPGARPMHPDWARSLRDQCVGRVPFFFKQWGEFQDGSTLGQRPSADFVVLNNGLYQPFADAFDRETLNRWSELNATMMARVGKRAAGCLLDGREWKQMPEVRP